MTDPAPADLAAPFLEAQRRLHALADATSDDAFNRKPGPKAWSAGECVVHLNKMAKGYLPVFEGAVAGDPPRGQGPFEYGWVSRRFIDAVRPGARPIPTARAMKPPASDDARQSDVDRARALERFDKDVARYVAVVEAADGLDLGRIKVRSPFLPILKLPLGAFLDAMGQHCLRHVGQAERAAGLAA